MKSHQTSMLLVFILLTGCAPQKQKNRTTEQETKAITSEPNQLTDKEIADGWKLLFDGKTTNGWHNFNSTTIGKKWQVKDDALYFAGNNKQEDEAMATEGGDIVTDHEFTNYELSLEWKISPGGNSGIIYNVIESKDYGAVWHTGPEMQILDNTSHPDAEIITHRAGDLYDLIPCSKENVKPVGEWNKVRLVINGDKLEHWMNGIKVVDTQMWTPEWNQLIADSKFKDKPDFGTARTGRIALQDHGDPVWFRNIKIKVF